MPSSRSSPEILGKATKQPRVGRGRNVKAEEHAQAYVVQVDALPEHYPTHGWDAEFWEALGRCVATFGFLEHTLARAYFAFSVMREISDEGIDEELSKWFDNLKKSARETLNPLIDRYENSVKSYPNHKVDYIDLLVKDLKETVEWRNILCHSSWGYPDEEGKGVPFFVNRKDLKFGTPVDLNMLQQIQSSTTNTIVNVINSVTLMGWQFPGTHGPGRPLFEKKTS